MANFQAFRNNYCTNENIELGFVVNLETLREALKTLNIRGRRWWFASDPDDAIDDGYVVIGYGDEGCIDRLNTVSFRLPVLTRQTPYSGTGRILVLFDASSITADQPGFYLADGLIEQDFLEDFQSFFGPVKEALIKRMQFGSPILPPSDDNQGRSRSRTREEQNSND
jgi:hypothetical protein